MEDEFQIGSSMRYPERSDWSKRSLGESDRLFEELGFFFVRRSMSEDIEREMILLIENRVVQ